MTGFLSMLYAPVEAHSIALSHTSEYLVKVFDIEARACSNNLPPVIRAAAARIHRSRGQRTRFRGHTDRSSSLLKRHLPNPCDRRPHLGSDLNDGSKERHPLRRFTTEGKLVDQFFLKWTNSDIKPTPPERPLSSPAAMSISTTGPKTTWSSSASAAWSDFNSRPQTGLMLVRNSRRPRPSSQQGRKHVSSGIIRA